jgi:hypothetical protein
MRKFNKSLGAKLLGVALFVSPLPSAFAVVLSPGDTVALGGTTAAARPELAGLVLVDTIRPWTITTSQGNITGRVQDRVVRENVSGTLDFYTRLFVDSVPDFPGPTPPPFSGVQVVDRSSYTGFNTDVDWRIDGLGNTAPSEASRSVDGSMVSFLFGNGRVTPADLPDGSKFFFIKTNATAFNALGLMDLGTNAGAANNFMTSFNVYQPVPEPSSMAVLLAGLVAVCVVAFRQMR